VSKLLSRKILLPVLAIVAAIVILALLVPPVVLPAIEIPAEPMLHLFGFPITNTMIATWLAMIVLIVLSYFGTRRMQLVPSGLQNLLELALETFWGLVHGIAGEKWGRRFFPIVATIFFFFLVSNWMGILPFYGSVGLLVPAHEGVGHEIAPLVGGISMLTRVEAPEGGGYKLAPFLRSGATDLNIPLAMAIISVLLTQYFGVKALGVRYFKKFIAIDFSRGIFNGLLGIFVGILELVSEFAKIISFTFRLFGNVFAGEVLLAVLAFLIPYLISVPFYGLEVFIGFIQALVFSMLTLVFFSLATAGHGEEAH
jgi:F-type H+-transporting ATPase subunit a